MANKGGGKPSDRRAGKRRDRNQRVGIRVPELGYYLIVTDTEETEKNYFEGLRDSIPTDLKDRLVIKVEKAKTIELVERALELANKEPQYRIPWIVFDRDQVKDFDEIIQAAEKSGIGAGWSNPCFGCMPILARCQQYGNLIHAVIGLRINLRRLRDRNILRRIRIFTANWCSMETRKGQFR